jgi:GT2 family glycosyltransferase
VDVPAADPAASPPGPTTPAVVAVVVTHEPGPWFEDGLRALAAQDYPDLTVLVIDAGSRQDPTQRVAAACPAAFVRRIDDNDGFAAAANEVLDTVEGASYLLLCHDDIALGPGAVTTMVDEASRSNAGLVGPKLSEWDDPRQLLAVGMTIDRTGHPSSYVEAGEYDQGQHDQVREVFYLPGGCQLIRADLFATLGGFDSGMRFYGEDLDLCWRARIAGARVVVAPQAQARHVADLSLRRPDVDPYRLSERHRLRTVLTCYGLPTLLWLVPVLLAFSIVDFIGGLFTARAGRARAALGAWTWNLARIGPLIARRRRLHAVRRTSDKDLRALQSAGMARVQAFQTRDRSGERRSAVTTVRQGLVDFVRSGPSGVSTTVWVLLGMVFLVGSRHLVTKFVPAVSELAPFPGGPSELLNEFRSGWRSAGLGSDAPAPSAFAFLFAWTVPFRVIGAMGLARTAFILGLIPLGGFGAWRLLRDTGSVYGRVTALVVYLACPVAYDALADGSLRGLVAYAAAPFLLGGMLRASRLEPFGDDGVSLLRVGLAIGVTTALGAAFLPLMVIVTPLMALALAAGILLTGQTAAAGRVAIAGAVGALTAVVLHLPWSLEYLSADIGAMALGAVHEGPGTLTVPEILRFQTGPVGAGIAGFAFLLLAAVPVVVGREWRAAWAIRVWAVTIAGWGVLWAGESGWLSFPLPAPEVMLAPAAAAMAMAAGLAAVAFERDVVGKGFSWRQVGLVAGVAALVIGTGPFLGAAGNGRWHLPRNDFDVALSFLNAEEEDAPFRVLWLGDPEVLVAQGWRLDANTAYATSDNGLPDVTEQFPGQTDGGTDILAEALQTATRRETNRLGDLLGPMGIRYIVVPERLAPKPFATEEFPLDPEVRDALSSQLDLVQINVNPAVTIYENAAWIPTRALLPNSDAGDLGEDAVEPRDALAAATATDFGEATPALGDERGPTTFRGPVDGQGELYLASGPTTGWHLEVDGESADRRTVFGWANSFDLPKGGTATLSFDTPATRYLLIVLQIVLWVVVLSRIRRPPSATRRPGTAP